jgi:DNA-binding NarL/FixJ family response regulator
MKRVFLAVAQPDERSALRLMLTHLNLHIAGEAFDWPSTLALAPAAYPDIVLVDWGLLSTESAHALLDLRRACAVGVMIVLISNLEAREQAALSAGADVFISKNETSDRIVERLQAALVSQFL